jgi:hypothetical protein
MIAGLLLFATVSSHTAESGVTPVQKVLQMMDEMVAKGEAEKHAEEVNYKAYAQFCKDTTSAKSSAITKATAEIEQLNADILKAQADQTQLADELKVLQTNLDAHNSEKEENEDMLKEEIKEYNALAADYKASMEAMANAIDKLKAQLPSLLQLKRVVSFERIPQSVKRAVTAYLQATQKGDGDEEKEPEVDHLAVSAPEAATYEFQSGGVIDMLAKLDEKFHSEMHDIEKAHLKSKHEFELKIQRLHDMIQDAEEEFALKQKVKAERAQDEATAKGDLATTTADKTADEKYLKDLTNECDKKATDFAARQKLRAEELEAIAKAKEIISGTEVTGMSEKHLPQLLQVKSKRSHALLRAVSDSAPIRAKLVSFLSAKAKSTKSHLLLALVAKASAGPFDKVKKMIKDMIVKLMEEATEESEHKGWCDTEMGSNKQTREDKANQVDTLTAQADELSALISKLGNEMATLSDDISAIDAAVAQATSLRMAEKSKNTEAIEDAKVAQVAVNRALAVLEEFYAKAAEATALVQQTPSEDAPATFDKPYKGMGGSSTGVLGMMEVIRGDFSRLETETTVAEKEADTEFTRFSDDSAQDKAVKSMDLENKSKDKTTAEADLVSTKKDLEGTQVELDAALAYYDKLKPSCVDAGLSYGERVRMREEEIKSLQEALRILGGEDI